MTYDPSFEDTLGRAPRVSRDIDPTTAVVVARLDDLRDDMKAMRDELRASTANVVSRGEWEQRNRAVDAKFESQGREIAHLRTDIVQARTIAENRRAPWWSIMAAIGSAVAIAAVIIPALAR